MLINKSKLKLYFYKNITYISFSLPQKFIIILWKMKSIDVTLIEYKPHLSCIQEKFSIGALFS